MFGAAAGLAVGPPQLVDDEEQQDDPGGDEELTAGPQGASAQRTASTAVVLHDGDPHGPHHKGQLLNSPDLWRSLPRQYLFDISRTSRSILRTRVLERGVATLDNLTRHTRCFLVARAGGMADAGGTTGG
jgi:hypothetical protein